MVYYFFFPFRFLRIAQTEDGIGAHLCGTLIRSSPVPGSLPASIPIILTVSFGPISDSNVFYFFSFVSFSLNKLTPVVFPTDNTQNLSRTIRFKPWLNKWGCCVCITIYFISEDMLHIFNFFPHVYYFTIIFFHGHLLCFWRFWIELCKIKCYHQWPQGGVGVFYSWFECWMLKIKKIIKSLFMPQK